MAGWGIPCKWRGFNWLLDLFCIGLHFWGHPSWPKMMSPQSFLKTTHGPDSSIWREVRGKQLWRGFLLKQSHAWLVRQLYRGYCDTLMRIISILVYISYSQVIKWGGSEGIFSWLFEHLFSFSLRLGGVPERSISSPLESTVVCIFVFVGVNYGGDTAAQFVDINAKYLVFWSKCTKCNNSWESALKQVWYSRHGPAHTWLDSVRSETWPWVLSLMHHVDTCVGKLFEISILCILAVCHCVSTC